MHVRTYVIIQFPSFTFAVHLTQPFCVLQLLVPSGANIAIDLGSATYTWSCIHTYIQSSSYIICSNCTCFLLLVWLTLAAAGEGSCCLHHSVTCLPPHCMPGCHSLTCQETRYRLCRAVLGHLTAYAFI